MCISLHLFFLENNQRAMDFIQSIRSMEAKNYSMNPEIRLRVRAQVEKANLTFRGYMSLIYHCTL